MGYALAFRRAYPFTSSFLNPFLMATIKTAFNNSTESFSLTFRKFDGWTANHLNELLQQISDADEGGDIAPIVQLNRYAEALLMEAGAMEGYRSQIVSTDLRHTVPPVATTLSIFEGWTREDLLKSRVIIRDTATGPVARQYGADQFAALYTALSNEIRLQVCNALEPGRTYSPIVVGFL
jgi:hypothetical protein